MIRLLDDLLRQLFSNSVLRGGMQVLVKDTQLGGPGTKAGGKTTVVDKSKVGGQFAAEDSIFERAREVKGKVGLTGRDIRTGEPIDIACDPDQIGRSLISSTQGWGVGSEWTN